MPFIVIETHGGAECAAIVTDTDGNNMVFDKHEEAQTQALDCQSGIIVEV